MDTTTASIASVTRIFKGLRITFADGSVVEACTSAQLRSSIEQASSAEERKLLQAELGLAEEAEALLAAG